MRVLILSNAPSPNNDALFRHVSEQPGMELLVVYGALREPHRLWDLGEHKGYNAVVLPGWSIGGLAHLNPGIVTTINAFKPDVAVLAGTYVMPTLQIAALLLRYREIPWVYWGEELKPDDGMALPFRIARRWLRWPIHRAVGTLAIGQRATASYARIGVPLNRIANYHYYADVDNFRLPGALRSETRHEMRTVLNVEDDVPVFIYCGRLAPVKRVDTLIDAADWLSAQDVTFRVLLVGDGPERGAIEARIGRKRNPWIRLMGFSQPAELPRYFAASDALVLPSAADGWGLVVSEALAAGLPIIASDRVNAAAELVRPGESGFVFPVGDAEALGRAMAAFCEARARWQQMSERASRIAEVEHPRRGAERLSMLLSAARAGEEIGSL
jgi:glycosyltransferase involved in cell wall biosynthesis